MKTGSLSLALCVTLLALNSALAQDTPPFEGLRFKNFSASFKCDYFTPHSTNSDNFFYLAYQLTCENRIEGGTNAYRHISLNGYWDPATGNHTDLNPAVEATNRFSISSNGVVGALIDDGLKIYLDGLGLASYGAADPPNETYQLPFQPFLGQGSNNIPLVGTFTGVSGTMEIVIEGDPAFTNDVVVQYTVTATDVDTGETIPDGDLQVGGESVTNGMAWVGYKEHSTNEVGVTVTGHDNWAANLSAVIYRPSVQIDSIVYLDANPDPDNTLTNACDDSQIIVTLNGTNVTGLTFPFLVGKKAVFSLQGPDGMTDFSWSIGGATLSNFVVLDYWVTNSITNSSGMVTNIGSNVYRGYVESNYPKTNQSVEFAWWQTGLVSVTGKCKIMGIDASAGCKVQIVKPGVGIQALGTSAAATVGEVYVDSNFANGNYPYIHLGIGTDDDVGTLLRRGDGSGEYGWVRIVDSTTRTTFLTNGSTSVFSSGGIDGKGFPANTGKFSPDSPGQPLPPDASKVTVNDQYSEFLIFRPTGNDVWVPLQILKWGWQAGATNSGSASWQKIINPAPVITYPGAGTVATNYPSWNKLNQQ